MDHNVRNIYLLYLGLRVTVDELPIEESLDEETLWYKGHIIELNFLHEFFKKEKIKGYK